MARKLGIISLIALGLALSQMPGEPAAAPGPELLPRPPFPLGTTLAFRPGGPVTEEATAGFDLYSIRPDGSGLRRLTNVGDVESWQLAPDRTRMAILRSDAAAESAALWSIRLDGTRLSRLSHAGHDVDVEGYGWSPESRRVAYASDGLFSAKVPTLYIADVRRRTVRKVATSASAPTWGPRDRISYREVEANGMDLTGRILIVRPDGKVIWRGRGEEAYWSPKGTLLAIQEWRRLVPRVVIRGRSGKRRRVLAGAEFERWSPDGERVLISEGARSTIVAAIGPKRTRRIPSARAVWSPNGRRIAYADRAGLFVGDGWGANAVLRRQWGNPQEAGSPVGWSPDGRFVLVWYPNEVGRSAPDDDQLVAVPAVSGAATTVAEGFSFGGVAWARAATIVFSTGPH